MTRWRVTHCVSSLIHMWLNWHVRNLYGSFMTYLRMRLDYMCGTTHRHMWRDSLTWDSFTGMTQLYRLMSTRTTSPSCIDATQPICMCDMTHTRVWHTVSSCMTWLVSMWKSNSCPPWGSTHHVYLCDVPHLHMWRDSFIFATLLIHTCGITHTYVWCDSFTCATWLMHTLRVHTSGLSNVLSTRYECSYVR